VKQAGFTAEMKAMALRMMTVTLTTSGEIQDGSGRQFEFR